MQCYLHHRQRFFFIFALKKPHIQVYGHDCHVCLNVQSINSNCDISIRGKHSRMGQKTIKKQTNRQTDNECLRGLTCNLATRIYIVVLCILRTLHIAEKD